MEFLSGCLECILVSFRFVGYFLFESELCVAGQANLKFTKQATKAVLQFLIVLSQLPGCL